MKETEYPVEVYTTAVDYCKHIASLSTGSILLIVAFLEKLFDKPEWKFCIVISLISFVVTIFGTLAAQAGVIEHITSPEDVGKWAKYAVLWGLICGLSFFMIGLISLVVFAFKNLY